MSAQSEVYSATRDTLFSKNSSSSPSNTHALTLEWVYGRTPTLPVLALQDHDQQVVLYAAANVGVIYNLTSNSQHILQGHGQNLSCVCVSDDRRWIATADPSPMVIVWDSYSGIPVCTLFHCHPKGGVTEMVFSTDAQLLVTVGAGDEQQHVCVWDWTCDTETPRCCSELSPNLGLQRHFLFSSSGSELLSCSQTHVLLHTLEQKSLSCFSLKLWKGGGVDRSFPSCCSSVCTADGALVQTAFHWREPQVLTATAGGSIVVWDLREGTAKGKNKVTRIHLQEAPFTVMKVTDSYVVTGDAEGLVRFFGQNFVLLAFYSDLFQDPVSSISFFSESTAGHLLDYPVHQRQEKIRNFIVCSSGSSVLHMNTESEETQIVLEEEPEPVHALCCHPTRPLLVTGSRGGVLRLRDTCSRLTVIRREFRHEGALTCVTFDPSGEILAVGFSSGSVHLLDSSSLRSDPEQDFHLSKDSITLLSFSEDSLYLAAADSGFAVSVLWRVSPGGLWESLGRLRSHFGPIQSLVFGLQLDSTLPRLLSLGLDRRLVEYDLQLHTGPAPAPPVAPVAPAHPVPPGLSVLSSQRVEQRAVPLGMTWYPPVSTEQFLLICSDQYKLRLINSTTHMCRKVILGPTYGSPLQKLLVLPKTKEDQSRNYHLAFITQDMVGLQALPADGNPFKSQALVCHPSGVCSLSASFDGGHVVTSGGADFTAMSWSVSTEALEAAAALGGSGMEPFYAMLDGGRHGTFYREMEDLFFFLQVRLQGTDSEQRRQVSTTIPLNQISTMMRAIGFFPTEQEIEDLQNELKFSRYAETGQYVTELDLEDFIKLYVNHRPAFGLVKEELEQAFNLLRGDQENIERSALLQIIQSQGEAMTEDEVLQSFSSLLDLSQDQDSPRSSKRFLPSEVSMESLAQILGFSSAPESN